MKLHYSSHFFETLSVKYAYQIIYLYIDKLHDLVSVTEIWHIETMDTGLYNINAYEQHTHLRE